MKESTPILFQTKDMVKDITLEPLGVSYFHLRSQEHPPVSGRVPDKCPNLPFSTLDIEWIANIVGILTLKLHGVVDLHPRSQEHLPLSRRVPDKCPGLFFQVLELKKIFIY